MPPIQRVWPIGSIVSAVASVMAVISVLAGLIWGYARVTYATDNVPTLKATQEAVVRDVAVLKIQQQNGDSRYSEILAQLNKLNDKVDRLNDSKADKQLKGWQR